MKCCETARVPQSFSIPLLVFLLLLQGTAGAAAFELSSNAKESALFTLEQYLNPAYRGADDYPALREGLRFPLGFAATLSDQNRNPLLYLTDREGFRNNFDLLSFYHQLLYPAFWLINPAQSPQLVELYLGTQGFEVRDESGSSLDLLSYRGPWNASLPLSPLLPPPRIALRARKDAWSFQTALFAGGDGFTYTPNQALADYRDRQKLLPETEYLLTGDISYSAGLQFDLIRRFELFSSILPGHLTWAPRILGWYRIAFIDASYTIGTRTDDSGTPIEDIIDIRLFSGYPGTGWGFGLRGDLGLLWQYHGLRLGASLLNLAGFDMQRGLEGSDGSLFSGTFVSRFASNTPPGGILTGSWSVSAGASRFLISGAYGYIGGHLIRTGFHWNHRRWNASLKFRWNGTLEFISSWGVTLGPVHCALSFLIHPAPFTGNLSSGLGFCISNAPGSTS